MRAINARPSRRPSRSRAHALHRHQPGGCAMRWEMGRRSDNIEDRRGSGMPLIAGGGIGAVVLLLVAMFFGFDPSAIVQTGPQSPVAGQASPQHDTARDFVSVVLADTEDTWQEIFRRMNREYREPKLV